MSDRGTPGDRLQRIARYRLLLTLAVVSCLADQATKAWIAARLDQPGEYLELIPGFFRLVHVGNRGAAWSILDGHSEILAVFALLTLAGIYFFRRHLGLELRPVQIAFGLICGGAIGNLIDRVRIGHVVDFLDFDFHVFHYPTFNVADSCIVCGVVYYVFLTLRPPRAARQVSGHRRS